MRLTLWCVGIFDVILLGTGLARVGTAVESTETFQQFISAGGVSTPNQWDDLQQMWLGAGAQLGISITIPILIVGLLLLRDKYRRQP